MKVLSIQASKNTRKILGSHTIEGRVSFIWGQILKYTFLCVWPSQKFPLYQKLPHT